VIGVTCHDATRTASFDFTRPGLDHLGLSCASEDEVREWARRMDELGVEHGLVETAPYGWAVTGRDPDGIAVEFFCPQRLLTTPEATIDGVGLVMIREIDDDHPRPSAPSIFDDWGDMAPEAKTMTHERWLIEAIDGSGCSTVVGDMSAHAVWNGPTESSRAYSIGLSIVEEYRGRGIGSVAQRLLADALHARGVVRVEASTDVTNIAEQKSLANAGFEIEGVLRSAQGRRDGLHDLQLWSHIASPS
jgi:RimJ/RimL family protein N-acetyltransferase